MVQRQQFPGQLHSDTVPDIEVAQGPLQSVSGVHDLDQQCQNIATCQFLVSLCSFGE